MTSALFQPADAKAIDVCTARLAVAFQRQIDAATIKIYRETLADLPLWAIEGAELQLRRKGGSFFPTAPEWHKAAEGLIADRQRENLTQKTSEVHECLECRDTGWCDVERAGITVCVPCTCRRTNATYQRSVTASRKSLNEEVK